MKHRCHWWLIGRDCPVRSQRSQPLYLDAEPSDEDAFFGDRIKERVPRIADREAMHKEAQAVPKEVRIPLDEAVALEAARRLAIHGYQRVQEIRTARAADQHVRGSQRAPARTQGRGGFHFPAETYRVKVTRKRLHDRLSNAVFNQEDSKV